MIRIFVPMATLKLAEGTIAPLDFARETYIKKMVQYGLTPVFISPLLPRETAEELYGECKGVLCMGGTDFVPATYGAKPHERTDPKEPLRDELEFSIIRRALADKKPFLGICRGCQALAIASGGTLHQHVPDVAPGEEHGVSEGGTYDELVAQEGHEVIIKAGTKTRALLGKDTIRVNSGHHQAVWTAGSDFLISGATAGGIAEIIEHTASGYFCFGIQGHPETQERGDLEPFFEAFAKAAGVS